MVKILLNIELLYLIMVVKGAPQLVILKSTNATTKVEVRDQFVSPIVVTRGRNFTLMCEVMDDKSGEQLDQEVVWYKRVNGSIAEKLINLRLPHKYEASKISFAPVMLQDRGIYFCTNQKYNLTRFIHIVVRLEDVLNFVSNQRRNGAEFSDDFNGINIDSTYPTRTEILKDAGTQQTTTAKSRNYRSLNNHNKNLNHTFYKTENAKTIVNSFGPLLYIVAIAAFSLIVFILYVAYQQTRSVEYLPTNSCTHPVCVRFRSANPSSGCLLETVVADSCTNERIFSISTFMNPLVEADSNSQLDHLDLPPSYGTSIRSDLPPTYDEAINTVLSEYRIATCSPIMASVNDVY